METYSKLPREIQLMIEKTISKNYERDLQLVTPAHWNIFWLKNELKMIGCYDITISFRFGTFVQMRMPGVTYNIQSSKRIHSFAKRFLKRSKFVMCKCQPSWFISRGGGHTPFEIKFFNQDLHMRLGVVLMQNEIQMSKADSFALTNLKRDRANPQIVSINWFSPPYNEMIY